MHLFSKKKFFSKTNKDNYLKFQPNIVCNEVRLRECDNLPPGCARQYSDVSRVRESAIVESPQVCDALAGTGHEHTRPATIVESLGPFLLQPAPQPVTAANCSTWNSLLTYAAGYSRRQHHFGLTSKRLVYTYSRYRCSSRRQCLRLAAAAERGRGRYSENHAQAKARRNKNS